MDYRNAVWVGVWASAMACTPPEDPVANGGSGTGSGDTGTTAGVTGDADGTTTDTGVDGTGSSSDGSDSTGSPLPKIDCETMVDGTLPGVSIDILSDCAYTLAQAQKGIATDYVVTISDALVDVDSGNSCFRTPTGGIHVEWRVFSADHNHCHCDVGLCPPYEPSPTTLVPGDTMGTFMWAAFDWDGPSDFDPPFGDPFEAGEYTIEVRAQGFSLDQDGAEVPFFVEAQRPVVLVE